MNAEVKREFERMVAARNRLVDVRAERMEQLLCVRAMLRKLLADFFETLDPITNSRLAEVTADGSKAHGNLAIGLSFFEGTRLRLAVDVNGRFSHSASIPSAFDDVERVVEIRVPEDLSRADIVYEPVATPGTFRTLALADVAMHLLAYAVSAVEAQLPVAPPPKTVETPIAQRATSGNGVLRAATSLGAFSARAVPAPRPPTPSQSAPIAAEVEVPKVKSDVLTLRLG